MTFAEGFDDAGKPFKNFGYTTTDNVFSLGLTAEWRVCERLAVFAEGRNLTGSTIYEWLHYYKNTPQGLIGIKMTF